MVDLVLVQADPADQVDLDLVGGGDAADQVRAADTELLGDRDEGGNVVAGMRVLGGQEGVVEVEFTHRDTVGPGRPLRASTLPSTPNTWAPCSGAVRQRLGAGDGDGAAGHRGRGHRGVVDDAVDDHRLGLRRDRDRVGGHLGDLPGQVLGAGKVVGAAPCPDLMISMIRTVRRDHAAENPLNLRDSASKAAGNPARLASRPATMRSLSCGAARRLNR